jgi:Uma2 family endonuclease
MTVAGDDLELRPFEPGTTGWTARDLDDATLVRAWLGGRYEIVEGVLTIMPAAFFAGGEALVNLYDLVHSHLKPQGVTGGFSPEVDIVINPLRVARADLVYLDTDAKRRQEEAAAAAGQRDVRRIRILVPPALIIESLSPGHEAHDRQTKRRWYAEFGVPNYWLLNVFDQSLECLVLDGADYRVDAAGRGDQEVRPSMFPGLVIPLNEVWED